MSGGGRAVHLILGVVKRDDLVEQVKVRAFGVEVAHGGRGAVGLDLLEVRKSGFVNLRAAQEARFVVGMLVDDFQRQADGLGAVFHEGEQQAVGVVQPRAVVRALGQFLDIGGLEIVALDGLLDLLELLLDAARVEVAVGQKTHEDSVVQAQGLSAAVEDPRAGITGCLCSSSGTSHTASGNASAEPNGVKASGAPPARSRARPLPFPDGVARLRRCVRHQFQRRLEATSVSPYAAFAQVVFRHQGRELLSNRRGNELVDAHSLLLSELLELAV